MKKQAAILLTSGMLLSLTACSPAAGTTAAATTAAETTAPAATTAATTTAAETTTAAATTAAETTTAAAETTTAAATTAAAEERTVTDMSGDAVTITGEVKSIINLWPAGTSSFFVMGAGDLVDGLAVNNPGTINSWAKLFYPEAGKIPAMGGTTPSIEELLKLDPDLVIVHPMTVSSGYAGQIRDAGIPAININFSTYDTMMESYSMLGEALGGEYQEKLNNWCEMITEKQESVRALTADLAEEDRPVVYYIAGQADSLTTTMDVNSICADWTHIAGGTYALEKMKDPNVTEVTAEEIFAVDPDIIIVGGIYQHQLVEELKNTDGWKNLSAVVNDKVYTNPYGAFAWDRFGLESYFQMDYALMCIQPELAEANGITRESMTQEVIDFYSVMNGTTLTKEQVGYMLDGLEPDGSMADPAASAGGPGAGMSGTNGQGGRGGAGGQGSAGGNAGGQGGNRG